MKAIVNTVSGQLQWRDLPTPEPGPGQVRVRTVACGICATDLHMIAGWKRTGFPAIPGHEWAGVVDAVGPGGNACLLTQPCVAENVLTDGGEVGFEHPGGYGQYLLTEERNVYPLPRDFPLWTAAIIEPLAVCVRGFRRLRLEDRSSAVIMGDGSIGLLMLLLLRAEKVEQITVVGGRTYRLAAARELGASLTLDHRELGDDPATTIRREAGTRFANVIEASGSAAAMQVALEVPRVGGKVLVMGDYGVARADLAWNHLLHREVELIGTNASADSWPEAVRLAVQRTVPLAKLISHRLPAERFAEAVELVRGRQPDVIKVILEWASASC